MSRKGEKFPEEAGEKDNEEGDWEGGQFACA
jgi:hypothetical protein